MEGDHDGNLLIVEEFSPQQNCISVYKVKKWIFLYILSFPIIFQSWSYFIINYSLVIVICSEYIQ